jgi:hypothetical protein
MEESFLPPHSLLHELDRMFGRMLLKLLVKPSTSKVMEHVSAGYDEEELKATRMNPAGMLEYLSREDAWNHLLPYRAPVSFPISKPVWKERVSPEIEAIPSSDDSGNGDGFIVEVEDEDEEEDGDEDEDEGLSELEEGEEEVMSPESVSKGSIEEPVGSPTGPAQLAYAEVTAHPGVDGELEMSDPNITDIDHQEEDSGVIPENRKRKSPPLEITRATKRRSSDEHHLSNSPDENHPSIELENNDIYDPLEPEDRNGKLPMRNLSEESLSSSDTQPLTPPLLQRELELRQRQRERAIKEPREAMDEIPHIPAPGSSLGRETEEVFKNVYELALDPFISCRCKICLRGPWE